MLSLDKKNVINLMIKKGVDTSGLLDGGPVDDKGSLYFMVSINVHFRWIFATLREH